MEGKSATALNVGRYLYEDLADKARDIRVLTLLPGNVTDPLKITIRNVPLPERDPKESHRSQLDFTEIRKTLPPDWRALPTVDGRCIFSYIPRQGQLSSWDHPDPNVPRPLYEAEEKQQSGVQFEALSYVWGSADCPEEVLIDQSSPPSAADGSHTTSLPIGENLAAALRHLRQPDKERTMWVDAICINQEDINERGEQVRLMPLIYMSASRVTIWLGDEADESGLAVKALESIGQEAIFCEGYSSFVYTPGKTGPWFMDSDGSPHTFSLKTWEPVVKLLSRPWFTRLWVVQEAQLGGFRSKVHCGDSKLEWNVFCSALNQFNFCNGLPRDVKMAASPAMTMIADRSGFSLSGNLGGFRHRFCSDDRDRVYAVLGFCPEPIQRRLQPNYSLSVGDVYKEAVLADAQWSRRLFFLGMCSLRERKFTSPSWIPDLTMDLRSAIAFQFTSVFGGSEISFQEPNILSAGGVECGTVERVSLPCPEDSGKEEADTDFILREFKQDSAVMKRIGIEGLVRTLCQNYCLERINISGFTTLQQRKEAVVKSSPSSDEHITEINLGGLEDGVSGCPGRSFFVTKCGLFGLCPIETKPGDIIAVLLGYDSTIVLRPTGAGTYQVVGSSFVPSLCDAVTFLGPMPPEWKVEYRLTEGQHIKPFYRNTSTGILTFWDPRLQNLDDWVCGDRPIFDVGIVNAALFRNVKTGETVYSDPRITPEALEKRGVKLSYFNLE